MASAPLSTLPPDDEGFSLSWQSFSEHAIFDNVDSIANFRLSIQFPRFLSWADPNDMVPYQDILYESIYHVLEQAHYYRFEELIRTKSSTGVGVTYRDADFGFDVKFSQDSELEITRDGSSFELFYGWYGRVLPRVADVISAVRTRLQDDASHGEARKNIEPARGMYTFTFILHDFKEPGQRRGGSRVKNARVLKKTLTHVPSRTGALIELSDDELRDLGRIDLKVSRIHTSPSGPVREVYDLQAPGNRDYGTLWLNCSYIAETPADTGQERGLPDFKMFLERYDYPLLEFVRQRALVNFLAGITSGLTFHATPGQLP